MKEKGNYKDSSSLAKSLAQAIWGRVCADSLPHAIPTLLSCNTLIQVQSLLLLSCDPHQDLLPGGTAV